MLRRLRRLQVTIVILLFLVAMVNFLDRTSLSIASSSIQRELHFSATQIGVMLSAFSLAYGVAQLPAGLLLDRKSPRIVVGVAILLWSSFQTAFGFAHTMTQFVLARIGLGVFEAPNGPNTVKVVGDWFSMVEKGRALGIVSALSTVALATSPMLLTALMLAFGWRGMFVAIGLTGIALAAVWLALYRNRQDAGLSPAETDHLDAGGIPFSPEPPSLKMWLALFRVPMIWGMMLGYSGINYSVWLYMSWLPGYLEQTFHLTLKDTGLFASLPFVAAALGPLVNGFVVDALLARGIDPLKGRKACILAGMLVSAISTFLLAATGSLAPALVLMCLSLFALYFAATSCSGLVQVAVPGRTVGSASSITNFASFMIASLAPVLTGWTLDRTHSFSAAFMLAGIVTAIGALSYAVAVRRPLTIEQLEQSSR